MRDWTYVAHLTWLTVSHTHLLQKSQPLCNPWQMVPGSSICGPFQNWAEGETCEIAEDHSSRGGLEARGRRKLPGAIWNWLSMARQGNLEWAWPILWIPHAYWAAYPDFPPGNSPKNPVLSVTQESYVALRWLTGLHHYLNPDFVCLISEAFLKVYAGKAVGGRILKRDSLSAIFPILQSHSLSHCSCQSGRPFQHPPIQLTVRLPSCGQLFLCRISFLP